MAPEQEHRRWKRELDQSKKREEGWVKEAKRLYARYRGGERKRNSFNLLWANTEILRPSVLNSIPKPDVRRRFRDADPIGKAVSEMLERALQVTLEQEGFENGTRFDVLDSLLVGRGVSRARYVPSIAQVGAQPLEGGGHVEETEEPTHEAHEGYAEELEYEQVSYEHVDWQDFRHGYGRVWAEVCWVGFRCKLERGEVEKRFGPDVANGITFDQVADDESKVKDDAATGEKCAEFWEIWDKEGQRVFFINESFERLIFPVDNPEGVPPLALRAFYPCPEPLRMVEDASSLLPIPLFQLYSEQADEVDRLSTRINRLVNALKVRGVYDATLSEIGDLMNGEDNDLIPVSKAAAWKENGGFDKAIWWMPIEQAAKVLQQLYLARDAAKQTIYEITGISDIVRGASNASETATAQQIKSQFASVRLERMRAEAARYVRDLVRIGAEIISEKFQPETLMEMTGLQFPTQEQKALKAAEMQRMPQGQPGQPPQPDPMMSMPTIEEILQVLRSDGMRQFRVDIETSSTVASSIESDMTGMREVLSGLIEFWTGSGPAVQAGALPIEAVKSISLEIVRRARMGLAVEDAIEQIKKPEQAEGDPAAAAMQAEMQMKQQQMQADQQMQKAKMQSDQQAEAARIQTEQVRAQADAAIAQARAQAEIELARAKAKAEIQLARERMQMEMELKREEMAARMDLERMKAAQAAEREASKPEAADA